MTKRCEEVVITMIVRTYNDDGEPINEQATQQMKVFRANAKDFWAEVDKIVASATSTNATS